MEIENSLAHKPLAQTLSMRLEGGSYKSIRAPLEWSNIPRFAILTGENGAGKTQLLEAINGCLRPPRSGQNPFGALRLSISPDPLKPHEILHIPDMAKRLSSATSGLPQVQSYLQELITKATQKRHEANEFEKPLFDRINQLRSTITLTPSTLVQDLSDELFYYNPALIEAAVTHHCANYEAEKIRLLQQRVPFDECLRRLGPAPWEKLNTLLATISFSYRLVGTAGIDVRDPYRLSFQRDGTHIVVGAQDLSAGETTLNRLFFWLFIASEQFHFPKLILMDEPDSHLHPSFIRTFVRFIVNMTNQMKCRAIMTTHRAETIAFAPEDSVFEMYLEAPRLRRSRRKEATVSLLTNNLVALVTGRRPVYVEDDDDVEFYENTVNILTEDDVWKDLPKPSFISSSIGKGSKKDSGGKDKVRQWVHRLSSSGLVGIVRGLIDGDTGNFGDDQIIVLDRNEHENYLLDPLVIYASLIEAEKPVPIILQPPITFGNEWKIRELPNSELDEIAASMRAVMEAFLRPAPTEAELVTASIQYCGGKSISFPTWLFTRGGRELRGSLAGKWPHIRHNKSLLRAYRKLRMVPCSLQVVLEECLKQ